MHTPLHFKNITLTVGDKTVATNVNISVQTGDRIALVGANGTGKTTLLRALHGDIQPSAGTIAKPKYLRIVYVPQHQNGPDASGGEQTLNAVYRALVQNPDILLLDEPTNHLDTKHKRQVIAVLQKVTCTTIAITHDEELLSAWSYNKLWHLAQNKLTIFNGTYYDFLREKNIQQKQLIERKRQLNKEQAKTRAAQQKEQHREAQSKKKGQKKYVSDKLTRSIKKRQAEQATGATKARLQAKQQSILEKLQALALPEHINPQFNVKSLQHVNNRIEIRNGSIGYGDKRVLQNINLSIDSGERVALIGPNGSGKSTLLKALKDDPLVQRTGEWYCPPSHTIGYFDQHYATVLRYATPFDAIQSLLPEATHNDIRIILNRFLFKTNQAVYTPTHNLSGGERVRLTLAMIATQTPAILLLDEITNNLDRDTRMHVVEVVRVYPGTLVVVSHNANFIEKLGITRKIEIKSSCVQ